MQINDMNSLNDILFEDIAYELDEYISLSPNPTEEYKNKIIPFFIFAFKYFNNILNDQEKSFLSNIETLWNVSGVIDIHLLGEIRKEILSYKESLSIDNVIHRYLASCLEFLTYQFVSESESEVSCIWLYFSGLIRASISRNWLYNNLIERYSQYLSDRIIKLKI
ncbi:hypothetical protein [Bacteroides thetaiotaomicron]|uniref:hypothetical protein n=2 Tax=Bacteroides thetaiotaomicron TaxID=818 RepID=UPI00163D61E3|nr:hypothetical protein [Bacteroides thetaiotaomicron]